MSSSLTLQRLAVTIVALVAAPMSLIVAASPPAGAVDYATNAYLTSNYSAVLHGTKVRFQAAAELEQVPGTAFPFGTVHLQRRKLGRTTWVTIASRTLSQTVQQPRIGYVPGASADYRIYYAGVTAGTKVATPSYSPVVRVKVRRNLHDGHVGFSYRGRVSPSYARRFVIIQTSTCARPKARSCRWTTYRAVRTNGRSVWSLQLPVHARRTHFRAMIKPSNHYLRSYSNKIIDTYRA